MDGRRQRAEVTGFGSFDLRGGRMEFSIDAGGHTNIESAEAKREEFV